MAPFTRNGMSASARPELAISFRRCHSAASLDQSFGETPPRTALPKLRSPTGPSSCSPLSSASSVSTSIGSTRTSNKDTFYDSGISFYSVTSSVSSVEEDSVFDSQRDRPVSNALMRRAGPRPRSVLQARSLPLLPPVFSSPLLTSTRDATQDRTLQLQHVFRSVSSQIAHESPETASRLKSQPHSDSPSRSFASRPVWTGRYPEPDPCLQVVSLSRWLQELGLVPCMPDEHISGERLYTSDTSGQALLLATGRPWQGSPEGNLSSTRQSKLDKTFVKHLSALIESGPLSLNEVADDLQIWGLKLHDRTARRRLADLFGRVLRNRRDHQLDLTLRHISGDDKPAAAESPSRHPGRGYTAADLFGGSSEEAEIGQPSGNTIVKSKPSTGSVRTYPAVILASTVPEQASTVAESHIADQSVPVAQAVISDEITQDEFTKRRKKRGEEEDGVEGTVGPRQPEHDDAQEPVLTAPQGNTSLVAERDPSRAWHSSAPDLDFGMKDRKDLSLEVEIEGQPSPTGLFHIKSPSPRSIADGGLRRKLFPRVRVVSDLHGDDEEDAVHETEDPQAQVLHPPPSHGRSSMRSDLQKQWRHVIRIAFERALHEVEMEWELGVSKTTSAAPEPGGEGMKMVLAAVHA